jgi:hypothetical protein
VPPPPPGMIIALEGGGAHGATLSATWVISIHQRNYVELTKFITRDVIKVYSA